MNRHRDNAGRVHEYASPDLGKPFRGNRPFVLTIM